MAAQPEHAPAPHGADPASPAAAPHTTGGTAAEGHGAASGGLPQFDPVWWPGQIVWLLIIFAVVFVLMKTVFIPRVGGTIARRNEQIAGDIAAARELKAQAEAQAEEAAAETAQARAQSRRLAEEAKGRARAEAQERQAAEEARLAQTMAAAEADIRAAREKAMVNVRAVAAETAEAIVEKLTGKPATSAEVERALAGRA
jgi:F-type H+-transporting ATPase subunit b